MSKSIISSMPIPVEGVDLKAELALVIAAPATPGELEALRWFISQQPADLLGTIERSFEDHLYWQQRDAQAALDGGW